MPAELAVPHVLHWSGESIIDYPESHMQRQISSLVRSGGIFLIVDRRGKAMCPQTQIRMIWSQPGNVSRQQRVKAEETDSSLEPLHGPAHTSVWPQ